MPAEISFETRNNPRMQPMREGEDQGEAKSDTGKKKSQRFQTKEVRTISSCISRKTRRVRNAKKVRIKEQGAENPAHPDSPIAAGKKNGDLISADRKILNVESESRLGHSNAPVVEDHFSEWLQGPTKIQQKRKKLARVYNGSSRGFKSEGELTQTVQTRS